MHENGFRDYDPAMGRYAESDPTGLGGGINTYNYAEDNPLNDYDRSGLQTASRDEAIGQIRAVGPIAAWLAYLDAQDAAQLAFFSGLDGLHNGPPDAFRHCVWSCLMTKSIGAQKAAAVGSTHEFYNLRDDNEPIAEFLMDTANNAVGRCVARNPKKNCNGSCMDKLNQGQLFGLGGIHMKAP